MIIPLGVQSTLVTGSFLHAAIDGSDEAREPDGIPAAGLMVRIVATIPTIKNLNTSPPSYVALDPIEAYTTSEGTLRGRDDGEGVRIISCDDPNIRPSNTWYYVATVSGPDWPTQVIPFVARAGDNFDLVLDADLPVDVETVVSEYRRLKAELQAMIDNFNGTAIAVLG